MNLHLGTNKIMLLVACLVYRADVNWTDIQETLVENITMRQNIVLMRAPGPNIQWSSLCLLEKYFILFQFDWPTLILKSEFFSHKHKTEVVLKHKFQSPCSLFSKSQIRKLHFKCRLCFKKRNCKIWFLLNIFRTEHRKL